ncbi:MAG: hypothetical protein ACJ8HQ_00950 [Chthoniobacterales bacterium]
MSLLRLGALALVVFASSALAQLDPNAQPVRVTVSQNDDGSRTAYEFDPSNHRATATTTSMQGKQLGKIAYKLDDSGRYESGEVFGPNNQFQYRTRYKYEGDRMSEETQLTKEGAVKLRLVYEYDGAGKQAGYAVYDASGKLLGRTSKRP